MRTLFALLLLTTQAFATDWRNLEQGKTYKLTQNIQLKLNGPSGSMLELMKGQEFRFLLAVSVTMPGRNHELYALEYKLCPGTAMRTGQASVQINNTTPAVRVGVHLETGCILNVAVGANDYYSRSLFED